VALTTEDITCVAEASDIVVDDIQLRRFLSHGLLSNSCYLFAVLDTEEPGVGWVGSTYLAVASVEGTDFRVLGRMEFSSNPLPRP
jgi:hypothetical protein